MLAALVPGVHPEAFETERFLVGRFDVRTIGRRLLATETHRLTFLVIFFIEQLQDLATFDRLLTG